MRRKDREIKEISEVLDIVERAKVLRMGLFDGEYPYIVPLHYGYEYKNEKSDWTRIFNHSSNGAGRSSYENHYK